MSVIIRLNVDEFEKEQAQARYKEEDLAKIMGLHPSTIWRTKKEKVPPGSPFIAAALKLFPHRRFEDLFFLASSLHESQATGTEG